MSDFSPDDPPEDEPLAGTPRWVKVFGIIALVAIVLFVILSVTGGTDHGPGRHSPRQHLPDQGMGLALTA